MREKKGNAVANTLIFSLLSPPFRLLFTLFPLAPPSHFRYNPFSWGGKKTYAAKGDKKKGGGGSGGPAPPVAVGAAEAMFKGSGAGATGGVTLR